MLYSKYQKYDNMGNCQTNLSEEELEFKRKQIFKPKPNINSNNSNK